MNSERQPAPPLPEPEPSLPPAPPELANLTLNAEEKLCAVLEGTRKFKTRKELAAYLNRTIDWLVKLRRKQEYQDLVQKVVADVARRMTEDAADIDSMFNRQIKPSVETLVEIRDNPFEKAADRIKSSLGLIDHAPAAPRAKSDTAPGLVLQIPVQQLEGIKEALADEGEEEMLELLEGKDFEQIEFKPGVPDEDFRVPVREID